MKDSEKLLADRILQFIDEYAGISPNYDETEEDSDNKYTAPDTYELLRCVNELKAGVKLRYPHSSWGSGGFKPYNSEDGKKEHDSILEEIKLIIKGQV